MLLRIAFLLGLLLPALLPAQTEKSATQILDQPGYSIEFPNDWVLDQSGMMGSTFLLIMPSGDPAFSPNINLVQQELPMENVDIDATIEATLAQLENMLSDFKLISNKQFNTPSGPCRELEYTGAFSNNSLHWKQRYWIKGANVFVLTFTTKSSEFNSLNDAGSKVLDSFWIK